jgi:hypothetical protein
VNAARLSSEEKLGGEAARTAIAFCEKNFAEAQIFLASQADIRILQMRTRAVSAAVRVRGSLLEDATKN